jgi:excisionase family DNA binding protein
MTKKLLTVKEAAGRLGISLSLVYELCKVGLIRCTRHGRPGKRGCIRIAEADLHAYLAAKTTAERHEDEEPLRHIR